MSAVLNDQTHPLAHVPSGEHMRLKCLPVFFALLSLSAPGFAQGPVGTWAGETSGTGGLAVRPIRFVLNADGSGTSEVDANVIELEDVVIDGSRVAFKLRPLLLGTRPAGFVFSYAGEVDGDTMTLNVTMEGGGGRGQDDGDQEPLVLIRQ